MSRKLENLHLRQGINKEYGLVILATVTLDYFISLVVK